MSGLGWDADGLCDDHNRFGCEVCRMTPNPNPSPELLPCPNPWCHSHERDFPLHRLGIIEWPIVNGRIGFRVRCSDCGICGPIVETKVAVYAAWNTRTLSPQTLPAPGEEWTIDLDRREIYLGNQMLFKVYSCDDFWHVEGEAAKGRQWFDEQAKAAVLTLNALATVAAANDEGVARGVEAAAKVVDAMTDAEDDASAFLALDAARAAMRLLSQGGGK